MLSNAFGVYERPLLVFVGIALGMVVAFTLVERGVYATA